MRSKKKNNLMLDAVKLIRSLADILEEISKISNDDASDKRKGKRSETDKKVTLEDVRGLLAKLSQHGKASDVKELIAKYGANKLSEINEEHYADLLKEAEGIKIE